MHRLRPITLERQGGPSAHSHPIWLGLSPVIAAMAAALVLGGAGCLGPAEHARAMKEAQRLRGQTAYDGRPAFGEPYGEWGREKHTDQGGN